MATLIWVLLVEGNAANPYDEDIKKTILPLNDEDQTEVVIFSTENEFRTALTTYYCSQSTPRNLSILIDTRFGDAIGHLLTTLKKPLVSQIPKIVLLSTLLTWSGKKYAQAIEDYTSEFIKRIPLLDTLDIYATENTAFEFARNCPNCAGKLYILSVGLLYGRTGYDFQDSFRAIFDSGKKLPMICDKNAKVPMVHIDQLLKVVRDLLVYTATLDSAVIPVVDNSYDGASANFCGSFGDVMERVTKTLNGVSMEIGDDDSVADELAEPDFRANLWNSDVWFGKSPIGLDDTALLAGIEGNWQEYISGNDLDPIKIMMAGTPSSGKTEVAKDLCKRLELQYIDPEVVIKYVFNLTPDSIAAPNISKEALVQWKEQITSALDSKAEAAKAKDKKKADVEEAPVWDDSELTDEFCRSDAIPMELLGGCVMSMVMCHADCRRKGFVIDMWDLQSDTLRSGKIFCDAFRTLVTIEDVPNNEGIMRSVIGLPVEVQIDTQVLLDKMTATFPPKPSKEQSAALKALETTCAEYGEALVPIDAQNPTAHKGMTHKGFSDLFETGKKLRINGAGKSTMSIVRVILNQIDPTGKLAADVASRPSTGRETSRPASRTASRPTTATASATTSRPASASPAADETPVAITDTTPNANEVEAPSPIVEVIDVESKKNQDAKDQAELLVKSVKFQNFLMSTVVPHLTGGLIRIAREQPEDPISYMSQYLQQQSETIQQQSRADAIEKFHGLLNQ